MLEPFDSTIDTIDLEIIRHRIQAVISPAALKQMSLKTRAEATTGQIVRQLELFLTGNSNRDTVSESISYPENWWEAVKERWFPRWLKKKFPVRLKIVGIKIDRLSYFICPHLNFDYSPHQQHLRFFLTNPRMWK